MIKVDELHHELHEEHQEKSRMCKKHRQYATTLAWPRLLSKGTAGFREAIDSAQRRGLSSTYFS